MCAGFSQSLLDTHKQVFYTNHKPKEKENLRA